jgi:hypothetical protein
MANDVLVIKKETFNNEEYMKTLKVSTELHDAVRNLAKVTNQPISKISCMLVEFALSHVKIEE